MGVATRQREVVVTGAGRRTCQECQRDMETLQFPLDAAGDYGERCYGCDTEKPRDRAQSGRKEYKGRIAWADGGWESIRLTREQVARIVLLLAVNGVHGDEIDQELKRYNDLAWEGYRVIV